MTTPGHADPQARARALLEDPHATPRAEVRALKQALLDAAQGGDATSQTLLGAIELEIERKPRSARRWFELAAAQDDAAAQRSLGYLYATGKGVRTNKNRAVELYREAAVSGDPYAMFNLAMENLHSGCRHVSFEQMVALLEGAAEAGLAEAAATLGDQLSKVDRDEEAVQAYTRAATLGHTGAMYALGCWARDGIVGAPDGVEAVRWYLTMMDAGDGNGIHHAIELAVRMSDDEIQQSAARAGRPQLAEPLIMAARGCR
jgi:TPR repeat protein